MVWSRVDPDFSDYTKVSYWEELPCGIYSIHLKDLGKNGTCMKKGCTVEVRKHEWMNSSLNTLIQWERKSTVPIVDDLIQQNNYVEKGNCNFRNSREAEENTSNGIAKRDLPLDFSLCPANCISQSARIVLIALQESVMLRTNVDRL